MRRELRELATDSVVPEARLSALAARRRLPDPILVTKAGLPPLEEFVESLREIWDSGWITNGAVAHQQLEERLSSELGIEHLSLVSSGTMGLGLALRSLGRKQGEVITTPFTFPATVHAIEWAGLTPVFADIESHSMNLDPRAVEECLTPRTIAVLPVHVFGTPADVEAFAALGRSYGVQIIYDAAHAVGVELDKRALASWGDLSVLSFHATKLFSTIEGGAVVCRAQETKEQVDLLRNFGILDEDSVECVGENGKMSEVHAAFGLLKLQDLQAEIERRGALAAIYEQSLAEVHGLRLPSWDERVRPNHGFFPVRVDAERFGMDRDALYGFLRECNILGRRYFCPLIAAQKPYAELPSARPGRLPVAEQVAREALCLPLYGGLPPATVREISDIVRDAHHLARDARIGSTTSE